MFSLLKLLSNKNLVIKCQEDPLNQAAWAVFYDRFHHFVARNVYHYLRRYQVNLTHGEKTEAIADLTQIIFIKLVDSDRKAIKGFRNENDNSIFAYLKTIANFEVINFAKHISAKKRAANKISLYENLTNSEHDILIMLDILPTVLNDLTQEQAFNDRIQQFRLQLKKGFNKKHLRRDFYIFYCAFVLNMKPDEIAMEPSLNISQKRIANIITDLKKKLKKD